MRKGVLLFLLILPEVTAQSVQLFGKEYSLLFISPLLLMLLIGVVFLITTVNDQLKSLLKLVRFRKRRKKSVDVVHTDYLKKLQAMKHAMHRVSPQNFLLKLSGSFTDFVGEICGVHDVFSYTELEKRVPQFPAIIAYGHRLSDVLYSTSVISHDRVKRLTDDYEKLLQVYQPKEKVKKKGIPGILHRIGLVETRERDAVKQFLRSLREKEHAVVYHAYVYLQHIAIAPLSREEKRLVRQVRTLVRFVQRRKDHTIIAAQYGIHRLQYIQRRIGRTRHAALDTALQQLKVLLRNAERIFPLLPKYYKQKKKPMVDFHVFRDKLVTHESRVVHACLDFLTNITQFPRLRQREQELLKTIHEFFALLRKRKRSPNSYHHMIIPLTHVAKEIGRAGAGRVATARLKKEGTSLQKFLEHTGKQFWIEFHFYQHLLKEQKVPQRINVHRALIKKQRAMLKTMREYIHSCEKHGMQHVHALRSLLPVLSPVHLLHIGVIEYIEAHVEELVQESKKLHAHMKLKLRSYLDTGKLKGVALGQKLKIKRHQLDAKSMHRIYRYLEQKSKTNTLSAKDRELFQLLQRTVHADTEVRLRKHVEELRRARKSLR